MGIAPCGHYGHYTVWMSWTLHRVDIMDITPCKHYGHYGHYTVWTSWTLHRVNIMDITPCGRHGHYTV